MGIRKLKPTTPGRRNMSVNDFAEVTAKSPEKSLLASKKSKAGRNNSGRITVRHQGGGHKKAYRVVDFKQDDKLDIPATIKSIEYDPNRSSFIALVVYADGEKRYVLAANEMKVGEKIVTKEKAKIRVGNRMHLSNIPVGFEIYNVEITKGKGGQVAKSAGNAAKLISLEGKYAQVQLPSGEVRFVHKDCFASIGRLGNLQHNQIKIGKAGRSRWMGKRPTVLGKSMNACDHPHGGGEGHSPIGLVHPKTPWGMPALGFKTRKRKYSNKMILKKRKK